MADPIRIPLAPYHIAQLRDLQQQERDIRAKRDLIVQTIMAAHLAAGHPAFSGRCEITNDALLITVPEPAPMIDTAGQQLG